MVTNPMFVFDTISVVFRILMAQMQFSDSGRILSTEVRLRGQELSFELLGVASSTGVAFDRLCSVCSTGVAFWPLCSVSSTGVAFERLRRASSTGVAF